METSKFNPHELINELYRSVHGVFKEYIPVGLKAVKHDSKFLAHLLCWNFAKGEIRDTKVALPIIAMRGEEYVENAIANLMLLSPRELVRAYHFNKELAKSGMIIPKGYRRLFEYALKKYLAVREADRRWWNKVVVQHRASMKELYTIAHYKPSHIAQSVLFDRKYPPRSIFTKIAQLKEMLPQEAAGTILEYDIPFQIALGALGRKKEEYVKHPEFMLVLLEKMSGQQLINNTKFLKDLGVFEDKVLKHQYDAALKRAQSDKKVATLKASDAIKAVKSSASPEDKVLKEVVKRLTTLQESKIEQKGIEGDWAVLGDKSGSMEKAIAMAAEIAGYIARSVKGNVYLIFFDTMPYVVDVTGKTLGEIKTLSSAYKATGRTSVGCGLRYLMDRNISVNGIAIASDGGDNTTPFFADTYKQYVKKLGVEPTVYFYHLNGAFDRLSVSLRAGNIPFEYYEMEGSDKYSLPNIVAGMKTIMYSLVDEIMNTPLLTLNDVFPKTK